MRCPAYLAVLVSVAFTGAAALAQTGPALLLKPLLSEDENLESRGDALILSSAQAEEVDFDMSIVEVSGRFRERRERLIPRIGWDLSYYSLRSDTPLLDQNLIDTSVAIGLELGQYYDWRAG